MTKLTNFEAASTWKVVIKWYFSRDIYKLELIWWDSSFAISVFSKTHIRNGQLTFEFLIIILIRRCPHNEQLMWRLTKEYILVQTGLI